MQEGSFSCRGRGRVRSISGDFCCGQHARVGLEHDSNAIAHRKGELIDPAHEFSVTRVRIEATFADRADENIQESGFHRAIVNTP